jgi:hypothetical protein
LKGLASHCQFLRQCSRSATRPSDIHEGRSNYCVATAITRKLFCRQHFRMGDLSCARGRRRAYLSEPEKAQAAHHDDVRPVAALLSVATYDSRVSGRFDWPLRPERRIRTTSFQG